MVFKLTFAKGVWTGTVVHSFSGPDGAYPIGGVTVDANGTIYGTTFAGGDNGLGVVWEITP